MNIHQTLEDIQAIAHDYVDSMLVAKSADAGLDPRCGRLYYNDDCIIVNKENGKIFSYYSGFLYVDSKYQTEMGDYIVYLSSCARVAQAISKIKGE